MKHNTYIQYKKIRKVLRLKNIAKFSIDLVVKLKRYEKKLYKSDATLQVNINF